MSARAITCHVFFGFCMIVATGAAIAERADREKPLNIEADRVTLNDKTNDGLFEGNVVLIQGTMRLTGDKVTVHQDKDGFQFATAYGKPVTFRQKRDGVDEYVEGYGERLEYDGKAEKVELFTRAMLKRNQDEVRGNYISYDINSEFFQAIGGGTQAASADNPQGRVRAVVQPKPKAAPAVQPNPSVGLKPEAGIAKPRE